MWPIIDPLLSLMTPFDLLSEWGWKLNLDIIENMTRIKGFTNQRKNTPTHTTPMDFVNVIWRHQLWHHYRMRRRLKIPGVSADLGSAFKTRNLINGQLSRNALLNAQANQKSTNHSSEESRKKLESILSVNSFCKINIHFI
jgi:hypothetical protein